MPPEPAPERPSEGRSRTKLIATLLVLGGLVVVGTQVPIQEHAGAFLAWVEGLGVFAPLIFVVLYAIAVITMMPTWWLSIGAGVLFGTVGGLGYAWLGASLGGVVSFFLGRTLMGETVRGWIDAHPRLRAIDQEIEARGWVAAVLLRLSPLTPWNILNYGLGVTRISLRGYLASLPAALPVLSLYAVLGSAAGEIARPGERELTTLEWTLLGVGLACTVVVTVWLLRVARADPSRGEAGS